MEGWAIKKKAQIWFVKARCVECGGTQFTGHQRLCRLSHWQLIDRLCTDGVFCEADHRDLLDQLNRERTKEMNQDKRYSWEPRKNCYLMRHGEELTECKGEACNCCGRFISDRVEIPKQDAELEKARARYHQDKYNKVRIGLDHVREKEEGCARARRTLEGKMEKEISELLRILFPAC